MRWVVLLAVAAIAAVVGVLYAHREHSPEERPPAREAPEPPAGEPAPPSSLPSIADRVRKLQRAPEVQALLEGFVAECVQRGEAAVPELANLLRNDSDITLALRWAYEGNRLTEYPTLRAAYLDALVGIKGRAARDALLEVLDLTPSVDEALFIAKGLDGRGDGGWTEGALEQAGKAVTPRFRRAQEELVALAAREDPDGTAAQLVARAPRGTDPADPAVLSRAVQALPLAQAVSVTRQVVADPVVTVKAKERYLRRICDRPEPETFAELRAVIEHAAWEPEVRLSLAYAAAGSAAFYTDRVTAGAATTEVSKITSRYRRRLAEVEMLVDAALADLAPDDPRRQSVARQLQRQKDSAP